ncbi:hypothetical protein BaRGS_00013567 [Batillaria attramentaria]|uniref:Uncharacterized protein n=1 Tax=Batillaria attramentaria TaxID=370345 RepID=A0ABD0L710_9CAEN
MCHAAGLSLRRLPPAAHQRKCLSTSKNSLPLAARCEAWTCELYLCTPDRDATGLLQARPAGPLSGKKDAFAESS